MASNSNGDGAVLRRLHAVPAFDGVRGVVVLFVVWYHAQTFKRLALHMPGGFLGVDVFFVLSGFLITALLLREQINRERVRAGVFYRRRALRLLPVIVVFVVVHLVFAALTNQPSGVERSSMRAILLYYANWKLIFAPPMAVATGHLWSLAVEEQFYLLWPIAMMLVTVRARLRTVLLIYIPIIAFVAVRRAVMYAHGATLIRLYVGSDTRVDALLIGALLAHLWVRNRIPKRGLVIGASVCVVAFVVCARNCRLNSPSLYRGGFTAIAVGAAVVLAAILETSWFGTRVFSAAPLRAIGKVSYGVYVWHPLVFQWVSLKTTGWPYQERLALALVITAAVTYASWTLIERPFIRWKVRLETAPVRV